VDKVGKSICATASSAYVPFSPYATPTQHNVVDSLKGEDGYTYSLHKESVGGPADQSINPNDAPPKLCSIPGFVAPAAAQQTSSFLTITSTSHEGSTTSSTPTPTSISPFSTKPQSQITSTGESVKETVIGGTIYHPFEPAIVHTEKQILVVLLLVPLHRFSIADLNWWGDMDACKAHHHHVQHYL
jgi:hypothetical protein